MSERMTSMWKTLPPEPREVAAVEHLGLPLGEVVAGSLDVDESSRTVGGGGVCVRWRQAFEEDGVTVIRDQYRELSRDEFDRLDAVMRRPGS